MDIFWAKKLLVTIGRVWRIIQKDIIGFINYISWHNSEMSDFNLYLVWIFLIITTITASFVAALQTLSYQFLGATPDYWCYIGPLVEAGWSQEEILDFAIPVEWVLIVVPAADFIMP